MRFVVDTRGVIIPLSALSRTMRERSLEKEKKVVLSFWDNGIMYLLILLLLLITLFILEKKPVLVSVPLSIFWDNEG